MRFEGFSFGSDGVSYDQDVVIDRGDVRRRKKMLPKSSRRGMNQ